MRHVLRSLNAFSLHMRAACTFTNIFTAGATMPLSRDAEHAERPDDARAAFFAMLSPEAASCDDATGCQREALITIAPVFLSCEPSSRHARLMSGFIFLRAAEAISRRGQKRFSAATRREPRCRDRGFRQAASFTFILVILFPLSPPFS